MCELSGNDGHDAAGTRDCRDGYTRSTSGGLSNSGADACDDPPCALFVGSDGTYYTEWQLERRLERGTWRRCLSHQDPDRHLLTDDGGELLLLERIARENVPPWLEVRVDGERAWTVDTRGVVRARSTGAESVDTTQDGCHR